MKAGSCACGNPTCEWCGITKPTLQGYLPSFHKSISVAYDIGVERGKAVEQERIIALLPDFFRNLPNGNLTKNLTAFIKGEK